MTTVLLLHGQPGSAEDWHRVRPLLAADYDVITPDRPGYDGSPPADLWRNADHAARCLDDAGADAAIVAGHSWGAAAAIATAVRHPSRVLGLVLIAPVGNTAALEWFDHVFARPIIGRMSARAMAAMGRRALSLALRSTGSVLTPDVVEHMHTHVEERTSPAVWRSWWLEQRVLIEETPYLQAHFADVHQPAVVLAGRRDRIVTPAMAQDLAGRLPQASYVEVDGGHVLNLERPEAIAEAIRGLA